MAVCSLSVAVGCEPQHSSPSPGLGLAQHLLQNSPFIPHRDNQDSFEVQNQQCPQVLLSKTQGT